VQDVTARRAADLNRRGRITRRQRRARAASRCLRRAPGTDDSARCASGAERPAGARDTAGSERAARSDFVSTGPRNATGPDPSDTCDHTAGADDTAAAAATDHCAISDRTTCAGRAAEGNGGARANRPVSPRLLIRARARNSRKKEQCRSESLRR
jgi:hypothetical protein